MHDVLYGWPFPGVICGLIGLGWLLRARRWGDSAWLSCLMLPMYMIHQFEEHGFDLLGRRYHFIAEMCGALGHTLDDCPADAGFIFAVNVGGVWIAGVTAILWRKTLPRVGAFALGIPLVNALAHMNPAIRHGDYNSGLFTSVVLFLPLCILALRAYIRAGVIARKHLPVVFFSGVLLHAILLGSLLAAPPYGVLIAIQIGNGFLPLAFARATRAWI